MTHERPHHGLPAHADPFLRAGTKALPEEDPRHARAWRGPREVHLRRLRGAHGAAGGRAGGARDRKGRPGRHAGVELAPASRGVLRGAADGRGPAHRQPAPLGAGHHLHCQSRRRSGPDHRREPLVRPGTHPEGPHERRARDRDEGHAGRPDPSGHARLRGAGGGCATARRMAEARRDRRGRHVLHVGHDRPSQGGGLHASRHLPPFDRAVHGGRPRAFGARRDPAHRAHVPRQCLVRAVRRRDERRHAVLRRPEPSASRHRWRSSTTSA